MEIRYMHRGAAGAKIRYIGSVAVTACWLVGRRTEVGGADEAVAAPGGIRYVCPLRTWVEFEVGNLSVPNDLCNCVNALTHAATIRTLL